MSTEPTNTEQQDEQTQSFTLRYQQPSDFHADICIYLGN